MIRIHLRRINRDQLLLTLDVVKFLMLLILAIAFVNFNARLSDEVSATKAIAVNQTKLLNQEKQATTELKNNTTTQLSNLNDHINCIVALFGQPNRANLTITNIQGCQLKATPTASASGGSTGSTKSSQPVGTSQPSTDTNKPQGSPASNTNSSTQPAPKPKHPLECRLTLGLLGC